MGDGNGRVGFVGLGVMGRPMAVNLLAAGHELAVYDERREALAAMSDYGARVVGSAQEAAEGAGTVITMLPDSPQVKAVTLGPEGIVGSVEPGMIVIDMSTISPTVSQEIGQALSGEGVDYLDAPVSGGSIGAERGTLSIMVGGSDSAFAKALPLLRVMGETVTHVGGPGMGQAAKLCNQIVVAINIQAVCEAFSLAQDAGVDVWKLRDVMLGGAASSWVLEELGPRMIDHDVSPGFTIALHLKDLRLAADLAFERGVPVPGAALATNLFLEARAHGEDDNGNQGLVRVYDRLSNRQLG